jgi:DNA-binding response OmpR family regulator
MLLLRRSERDLEIAYYEGADDYLKKPCEPSEVVFRVEELLQKQRVARS